jgi:ubiquinone/menaquinone biosynthesis C-methylase UbiE
MKQHVCPWWLSFILDNIVRRTIHDPHKILKKFIHKGDRALDIGCGPGYFTVEMAKLAGDKGRVIAADLQDKMLSYLKSRAEKAKVDKRIIFHKCGKNKIGIKERLDFILVFYMAHEVPDIKKFFTELKSNIKKNGILLLCEPIFHVSKKSFHKTIDAAYKAGFKKHSDYKIAISRTVLLTI